MRRGEWRRSPSAFTSPSGRAACWRSWCTAAVGVRGFAFENHFAAFEHCALGDQDSGVVAGIFVAVRDEPFSEIVDVEFMFWNHAAMSGSGHSGKHSGEAGVATKNFQHEEAFMRAGGSAQSLCQLNGAR